MADPLSLDTYVIGRPDKFSLTISYGCYDKDGTKLFDVKHKLLSGNYELLDSANKVAGVMKRKVMAITPVYELYDGGNQLIGKVVQEMNIAGSLTGAEKVFSLQDAKGNKVATLKISSPLAMLTAVLQSHSTAPLMAYDVMSTDGSATIAKISRQIPQAMVQNGQANFVLQIIAAGSIPALALVEFTIAVDHLYGSSNSQMGGMNIGQGVGFGGGGGTGFGGSGFGIKL